MPRRGMPARRFDQLQGSQTLSTPSLKTLLPRLEDSQSLVSKDKLARRIITLSLYLIQYFAKYNLILSTLFKQNPCRRYPMHSRKLLQRDSPLSTTQTTSHCIENAVPLECPSAAAPVALQRTFYSFVTGYLLVEEGLNFHCTLGMLLCRM